jgi:pimeloyl-ACP methyl ester carboxylesterase
MPFAELEGLRIHYERAGAGKTELLFVPGWCCDHTAFQPQFDYFAGTHTVTAIDPRGCGLSDAPADGYGVRDFADDLAQFCDAVGIEKPVIIGHSLGGMVAVEVGARYPLLPSALVLVDPGPIDPPPSTVKFFDGAPEHLAGPRGEDVRQLWVHDFGARDPEIAQWIVDLMSAVPLPVATEVIRRLNDWNGIAAFDLCLLPTLLIRANLGGTDSEALRLRAHKPDLQIGVTVGAGHFHQIEVPEQVNAMIERFLEISL